MNCSINTDNQGDDDDCQTAEDGIDDGLTMELVKALAQTGGYCEDEMVIKLEHTLQIMKEIVMTD